MIADNSMHPVTKEGDLNDRSVLLKDVYHVPGLEKNLATVSQITDQEGMFFLVLKMFKYYLM